MTVPVKAFNAAEGGQDVRLNQLHAECNSRIKHVKTCPEHGSVTGEEIVSGYEYAKGQYVVVDLDELQKLRPESDSSVRIDGFIAADTIEPLYFAGRTYYLLPDGVVGQKPYALLLRAMVDDGVHAIAQVVIAGREQVVLIRPLERLLAMTVLTQEARIKLPATFDDELVEQAVTDEELSLTKTLIGASKITEFDYGKYTDTYSERLTQLIQAKVDGHEIVEARDPEEPKILNLMEALKKSVAQAQMG